MSAKGFTLVELLVSMAITSVLLIATFAAVTSGAEGFTRMSAATELRVEAREGLTQIARDLEGYQWGTLELADSSFGVWDADEFSFLSRLPLDAQDTAIPVSPLCLIIYKVRTDRVSSGRTSRTLYRKTVPAKDVLEAIALDRSLSTFSQATGDWSPIAYNVLSLNLDPDSDHRELYKLSLTVVAGEIAQRLKSVAAWQGASEPLASPERVEQNEVEGARYLTLEIDTSRNAL